MRNIALVSLIVATAGCSSLPQSGHTPSLPVTVAEIQQAIACEFFYAFQNTNGKGRSDLLNWGAIVELALGVKDSVNVVPGLGGFTAKAGDASLTATPSSLTLDNQVEDKNTIAYGVRLDSFVATPGCPKQHSLSASSGLELAEFLVGTAAVINAGGSITSTTSLASAGIASNGTLIGPTTEFPGLTVVREKIPTIRYERAFAVSRKVGGGLTFKLGDVSLSLTGTGAERARALKDNKIVITMGKLQIAKVDALAAADEADAITLEDSIWDRRQQEIDLLRQLRPNDVIVVTPPPAP